MIKTIKPTTMNVSGLSIQSNPSNLWHDLSVYIDYVSSRDVKRTYRENLLSKSDGKRLEKMISAHNTEIYLDTGYSPWLEYIDDLAVGLGLVFYDTEGTYAGYSSQEKSYPDNYIEPKEEAIQNFFSQGSLAQTYEVVDYFVKDYSYNQNEFFPRSPYHTTDSFDYFGCGCHVLPLLNFEKARQSLFNTLKELEPNKWYAVNDLIHFFKKNDPFFLIPQKPRYKYPHDAKEGRLANFKEWKKKDKWGPKTKITEDMPNAFERVEGRYIERFLEDIPFSLGFLDLAYGEEELPKVSPSLGTIKAFRLRPYFKNFMEGTIPEPKVTILPNFEIQIESMIYPLNTLNQLLPFSQIVKNDSVIILKLLRENVVSYLAENPDKDVLEILAGLAANKIPENVCAEIEEWEGHSSVFTLYRECSLLEGKMGEALSEKHLVKSVSAHIAIVKLPNELFDELETNKMVPLRLKHKQDKFQTVPLVAKTIFPKKAAEDKAKKSIKKPLIVKREVKLTFHFPSKELAEKTAKFLLKEKCIFETDKSGKSFIIKEKDEPILKKAAAALKKQHTIQIKKMEDT